MRRTVVLFIALLAAGLAVQAHHGGGTFDSSRAVTLTGKLTKIDFINPHSWIYFDVKGPDGKVKPFRCETRSAHTLRRSGWTKEMFKIGETITIEGSPDRNDPQSCYLSTIVLQNGNRMDRYGQFVKAGGSAVAKTRTFTRRPTGEPDISGDWAPEQLVMTDPRGRGGALVPLSTVSQYKPGEGRIGVPQRGGPPAAAGRGGPRLYGGSELTEAGTKAAAAFGTFSEKDNPRMRCETTSIVFDWTFDGPVNRITQKKDEIEILYGQLDLKRIVHMKMTSHPANLKATRAGHSIGRWENDVLIVDTVGFLPGVLNAPVLNSDKLHVVERFSLDPKTLVLTRDYTAEDPVYLKGRYTGSDKVERADQPYTQDSCKELGLLDYSKESAK